MVKMLSLILVVAMSSGAAFAAGVGEEGDNPCIPNIERTYSVDVPGSLVVPESDPLFHYIVPKSESGFPLSRTYVDGDVQFNDGVGTCFEIDHAQCFGYSNGTLTEEAIKYTGSMWWDPNPLAIPGYGYYIVKKYITGTADPEHYPDIQYIYRKHYISCPTLDCNGPWWFGIDKTLDQGALQRWKKCTVDILYDHELSSTSSVWKVLSAPMLEMRQPVVNDLSTLRNFRPNSSQASSAYLAENISVNSTLRKSFTVGTRDYTIKAELDDTVEATVVSVDLEVADGFRSNTSDLIALASKISGVYSLSIGLVPADLPADCRELQLVGPDFFSSVNCLPEEKITDSNGLTLIAEPTTLFFQAEVDDLLTVSATHTLSLAKAAATITILSDLGDGDQDGVNNITEIAEGSNPLNPDSDFDGIPDDYELKYGLLVHENDAGSDPDQDWLNNLQEYVLKTDPRNADTDGDGYGDAMDAFPHCRCANRDSDGDGIPDNQHILEYRDNGWVWVCGSQDIQAHKDCCPPMGMSCPDKCDSDDDGNGINDVEWTFVEAFWNYPSLYVPISQEVNYRNVSCSVRMTDYCIYVWGHIGDRGIETVVASPNETGSIMNDQALREKLDERVNMDTAITWTVFYVSTMKQTELVRVATVGDAFVVARNPDSGADFEMYFTLDASPGAPLCPWEGPNFDPDDIEVYNACQSGVYTCYARYLVEHDGGNSASPRDLDGDGIPNWWEKLYGFNIHDDSIPDNECADVGNVITPCNFLEVDFETGKAAGNDACECYYHRGESKYEEGKDWIDKYWGSLSDPDGDGLSNLVEYKLNSDPRDVNSPGLDGLEPHEVTTTTEYETGSVEIVAPQWSVIQGDAETATVYVMAGGNAALPEVHCSPLTVRRIMTGDIFDAGGGVSEVVMEKPLTVMEVEWYPVGTSSLYEELPNTPGMNSLKYVVTAANSDILDDSDDPKEFTITGFINYIVLQPQVTSVASFLLGLDTTLDSGVTGQLSLQLSEDTLDRNNVCWRLPQQELERGLSQNTDRGGDVTLFAERGTVPGDDYEIETLLRGPSSPDNLILNTTFSVMELRLRKEPNGSSYTVKCDVEPSGCLLDNEKLSVNYNGATEYPTVSFMKTSGITVDADTLVTISHSDSGAISQIYTKPIWIRSVDVGTSSFNGNNLFITDGTLRKLSFDVASDLTGMHSVKFTNSILPVGIKLYSDEAGNNEIELGTQVDPDSVYIKCTIGCAAGVHSLEYTYFVGTVPSDQATLDLYALQDRGLWDSIEELWFMSLPQMNAYAYLYDLEVSTLNDADNDDEGEETAGYRLTNLAEFGKLTDPKCGDTDADELEDGLDAAPLSRVVLDFTDDRFILGDVFKRYGPVWWGNCVQQGGVWTQSGWRSEDTEDDEAGLVLKLDTSSLLENLVDTTVETVNFADVELCMNMTYTLYPGGGVVLTYLKGVGGAVVEEEVAQINYPLTGLPYTRQLILPLISETLEAANRIMVYGQGEVVIQRIELFIDQDRDGLDMETEYHLGTNDTEADTDGDGFDDYLEIKLGYDPLALTEVSHWFVNPGIGSSVFNGLFDNADNPPDGPKRTIEQAVGAAGSGHVITIKQESGNPLPVMNGSLLRSGYKTLNLVPVGVNEL